MTSPDDERRKRQRQRSIAIGLALGALVIMAYVWSMIKMSGSLQAMHEAQPMHVEQPKN